MDDNVMCALYAIIIAKDYANNIGESVGVFPTYNKDTDVSGYLIAPKDYAKNSSASQPMTCPLVIAEQGRIDIDILVSYLNEAMQFYADAVNDTEKEIVVEQLRAICTERGAALMRH